MKEKYDREYKLDDRMITENIKQWNKTKRDYIDFLYTLIYAVSV